MPGIKETREALTAFNEITVFLITRLKDGLDFDDFAAMWNKITKDEEFRMIVEKAYDGIGQIPLELEDIDFAEGVALGQMQLEYLPKMLEAIKK